MPGWSDMHDRVPVPAIRKKESGYCLSPGFLYPYALANAINIVLKDENIYSKIQKGAVNTAKRYDYEVIAHRYAEFMGLI
jgi:glycosyltransferase involved in cell wall biosynthesis